MGRERSRYYTTSSHFIVNYSLAVALEVRSQYGNLSRRETLILAFLPLKPQHHQLCEPWLFSFFAYRLMVLQRHLAQVSEDPRPATALVPVVLSLPLDQAARRGFQKIQQHLTMPPAAAAPELEMDGKRWVPCILTNSRWKSRLKRSSSRLAPRSFASTQK